MNEAVDDARFSLGFSIGRLLAKAEFREYLKRLGWHSGEHFVPALPQDNILSVCHRASFNDIPSPFWVVYPDEEASYGIRFMQVTIPPQAGKNVRADFVERSMRWADQVALLGDEVDTTDGEFNTMTEESEPARVRVTRQRDNHPNQENKESDN